MSEQETPESPRTSEPRGATSAAQNRHLLVFSQGASWMYQLPEDGSVVIGRSEAADLQIDSTAVSRQHARLRVAGGAISIEDLGSHNGTFVNRERITGVHALA